MFQSLLRGVATAAILACSCVIEAEQLTTTDAALLKKHVQFLNAHLNDEDERIRGTALNALAVYDLPGYKKHLETAVKPGSSETMQSTALSLIRGHAGPDILAVVRDLVVDKEPKTDKDGGVDAARLIIESDGLDVLLASSEPNMRAFAVDRLRTILQSRELPLFRWACLVDVARRNNLRELAPIIRAMVGSEEKEAIAIVTLAKLGDQEARKCVQAVIASGRPVLQVWSDLVSDPKAARASGIDPDRLRALISKHTFERPSEKYQLLARLGDQEGLLRQLRDFPNVDEVGGHSRRQELDSMLSTAAECGDERIARYLDQLFEVTLDSYRRIDCSNAIVQILVRRRTSPQQQQP